MAEFVQQRIEEMVGELNHLQNVGLFDTSEIREIVRKRKALEYKLRRKTKEKQDFLLYIKYEMNLLALIKKRRKANKCLINFKEIEVPIVKRIHQLFDMACVRFKEDIKFWLSHIEFSKQKREKKNTSRLFTSLLKIHPHKPDLWVLAARHEMELRQSMSTARGVLLQAISANPESQQLWLQYFHMELLNTESLRLKVADLKAEELKADESSAPVLNAAASGVVYTNACLQFPDDIDLRRAFLDITRRFNFTQHLQDEIYTELQSSCSSSEVACCEIAKRPLYKAFAIYNNDFKTHKDEIKSLELESYRLFDAAVVSLPTVAMWSQYLETCLEVLQQPQSKKHSRRNVQQTLNVFERAAECHRLSEQLALSWLTVLSKTGQVTEALTVSDQLVRECQLTGSVSLWTRRVSLVCQTATDAETVMACIDAAVNACLASKDESAVELWRIAISWCITNCTRKVAALCERGLLAQSRAVCLYVKQVYLDFVATHGELRAVRDLYRRLAASRPTSVRLVESYVAFELGQAKPKMKHVRRAYEEALLTFGSQHIEIWLNYMRVELRYKPENVARLGWRAEKDLEPSLVDDFKQQFSQLTVTRDISSS